MKNFKEIAEKCLAGELSGTFVTDKGNNWHSNYLRRHYIVGNEIPDQYVLGPGIIYNTLGQCENRERVKIIDFIPDMKQQITIDIPEGMEAVQETVDGEIRIKFVKKKPLDYHTVVLAQKDKHEFIHVTEMNEISKSFNKKAEVFSKLTNIRNYFGKPDKKNSDSGWIICINGTVHRAIVEQNSQVPVFAEKEHAEQAIKMLGDELKYLFEPW